MNSLDFLYFSLGGGFLILVGFLSYMIFYMVLTLKSLNEAIDDARDLAEGVVEFKDGLKATVMGILGLLSGKLSYKRR